MGGSWGINSLPFREGEGVGLVGKVEARWFAVEDIGPGHKERGTCKVMCDSIILCETADFGKTALCIRDGFARVTLGNDAETVTRWGDGNKINTRGIIINNINNFIFNNWRGNQLPAALKDILA